MCIPSHQGPELSDYPLPRREIDSTTPFISTQIIHTTIFLSNFIYFYFDFSTSWSNGISIIWFNRQRSLWEHFKCYHVWKSRFEQLYETLSSWLRLFTMREQNYVFDIVIVLYTILVYSLTVITVLLYLLFTL